MADTTNNDALMNIFRRVLLPVMGVAETIGTNGRSPGTVARQNMQIFDQADRDRREQEATAKKQAMEEELFGMRKSTFEDERANSTEIRNRLNAMRAKSGRMDESGASINFELDEPEATVKAGAESGAQPKDILEALKIQGKKTDNQIKQERLAQLKAPKPVKGTPETRAAEKAQGAYKVIDMMEAMDIPTVEPGLMGKSTAAYRDMMGKASYNQNVAALQSFKRPFATLVARRMFGEVGVLTEPDIETYSQAMYSVYDTPRIRAAKRALFSALKDKGASPDDILAQYNNIFTGGKDRPNEKPNLDAGGELPVIIKTDAEYEALPSGKSFIGPDGSTRRKP